MARLTYEELRKLALGAGFSKGEARIAAAIALGESGGDPNAKNTRNTNGTVDYGLWQINSVHSAILSRGVWNNPRDNAAMAYAVYKNAGMSFKPWVVFNNGGYRKHMPSDKDIQNEPEDGDLLNSSFNPTLPGLSGAESWLGMQGMLGDVTGGVGNVVSGVGTILSLILDLNFWRRVGYFTLGALLLIVAIIIIISRSEKAKQAASVATTVATKGKVK